ncbi:Glucuronoxylanase XynC [Diplonema papillatum]|nr:Glucuronoxylanase XynC [Diplonema papillatum]
MLRLVVGLVLCFAAAAVVVEVDPAKRLQKVQGFGAANIPGWVADLTPAGASAAFGTSDGQLGFTIMRIRIPPSPDQFPENVPTCQAATRAGVKIIATPWTPPADLKTNNNTVGGYLKQDSYAAYAEHLKSFAEAMRGHGVPLHAISVQNEPDIKVTYESCFWTPPDIARFLRENAAAVGVPMFASESFDYNHTLSDAVLQDPAALANLAFVGGHIYGAGLDPYPLAAEKNREVWMTEHFNTGEAWPFYLDTGREIHDCLQAGMSAYVYWYIGSSSGPLENDQPTQRGFVMSHFSKFVRPDAYLVSATAAPAVNVSVSAFDSAAGLVLVVVNQNNETVLQDFSLAGSAAASCTPYVTTNFTNVSKLTPVPISGGRFQFKLEPSSISTLTF